MFSLFFKKSLKFKRGFTPSLSRGFSLLELIVVITIFLIITATVMTDIPNFKNKSALDLTVGEVATYIRGAQVYGKAQVGCSSGCNYGIHLATGIGVLNNFYLYKDGSGSPQENYQLEGFYIESITDDKGGSVSSLDIEYPSQTYLSSFATDLSPKFKNHDDDYYFKIEIRSVRNSSESGGCIFVYKNGQITVDSCVTS